MKAYKSRLQEQYEKELSPKLAKQLGYENRFQVPKLLKIVVSMGVKEGVVDSKAVDKAVEELMLITGQKPVVTKAKKAIAAFKLREGLPIGCKVTLRKSMMYDFMDRFVNIALPRVKDFRGLSPKKFDGKGNYAVGIKEHLIFPEINYDKVDKIRGMNIVFVTTAKTNEEALELLKLFNFPFTN
jgi:large subunit ribosomal protein L5